MGWQLGGFSWRNQRQKTSETWICPHFIIPERHTQHGPVLGASTYPHGTQLQFLLLLLSMTSAVPSAHPTWTMPLTRKNSQQPWILGPTQFILLILVATTPNIFGCQWRLCDYSRAIYILSDTISSFCHLYHMTSYDCILYKHIIYIYTQYIYYVCSWVRRNQVPTAKNGVSYPSSSQYGCFATREEGTRRNSEWIWEHGALTVLSMVQEDVSSCFFHDFVD